jgi:pilus assembly protein CpaC
MIHHSVEGGKSSHDRTPTGFWSWRRWAKTVSSIGACLLIAVGAAKVAAQSTFLPPAATGQPVDAKLNPIQQSAASQPNGAPPTLSQPRPLAPFGPGQVRLPRLPGEPGVVGAPPVPTPAVVKEYGQYVKRVVRPENTLDVVLGQPHLLILQDVPKRVQIGDEFVATYTIISPTEISILGKDVGSTVLNLWFTDGKDKTKEKVLSYLVRVLPDAECKCRLERVYKALELEIAHAFPDSRVNLMLCGDKLLVCGQAKDVAEANYILDVVRANVPAGFFRLSPARMVGKIPVDRIEHSNDPADLRDGAYPPGVSDYELGSESYIVNMLKVAGEQQVSLMVTVVEVNRAAARTIGVNFNLFNHRGLLYFGNQTGQIVPNIATRTFNPLSPISAVGGINMGNFNNLPVAADNGQVMLAISALRELNYARTLSEPNLVTMNGQPASFMAGDLFPLPYVAAYSATGLQGISYYPVGVQLQFTPFITDKDRIRLQINAEVSGRDLTTGETIISGNTVPTLTTRNFQTTVELREGQTLAVAGLIQNKLGTESSRVPFFGDLPFFGRAFAFDHTHAEEQELVILITPELVHPMERHKVPPLPGCDIFEPGDLEFYLLGRLESRRSYDYRSPVMTDMARMCRYHKAEQIYIAGPHGHSLADEIGLPDIHDEPPPAVAPAPKEAPPRYPGSWAPPPRKLKVDDE